MSVQRWNLPHQALLLAVCLWASSALAFDPFIEQVKLINTDSGEEGEGDGRRFSFGYAVGISGDVVVVGAHDQTIFADGNIRVAQGAVYVYVKPPGDWQDLQTFSAKLVASDGSGASEFGREVAIVGDTIVITAVGAEFIRVPQIGGSLDGEPTVIEGVGEAYVFQKPTGGWSGTLNESAKLLNLVVRDPLYEQPQQQDFGIAVAFDGNTIVVESTENVGPKLYQGAAYVYEKPVAGWTGTIPPVARLSAADGEAFDNMGFSVAVHGDVVAVSAPGCDNSSGAVYVFQKP